MILVINGGSTPMINMFHQNLCSQEKRYIQYLPCITTISYMLSISISHHHHLHIQLFFVSISAREVDVGRACDKAFLQDLKAFIDQRIEEPRATGRWTHRPQPDPTNRMQRQRLTGDGLVGRFVGEVEDGGDWWCSF